jgi:hypothetical protein
MACSCGCKGRPGGCGQTRLGSPDSCGVVRLRLISRPQPITPVGELRGVIYRASRSPGDPARTYVHFFNKRLPVLATNSTGTRLYIVGGRYRVTSNGIEG